MKDKPKVLVVGAGTMGHAIAQVFATYQYPTTLVDNNPEQLANAKSLIRANLSVFEKLGDMTAEQCEEVIKRINFASDLKEAALGAEFVVEAVPEDPAVKAQVFAALDEACSREAILASTTSVLNIYEYVKVSNPGRLIIAHFFNPAYIIPLVEIVMGPETTEETVNRVKEIVYDLEKLPAVLRQYVPGFIVNRLTAAIAREAGYMVTMGWTTWEDVDRAVIANYGPKFAFEGPLELFDHIGWDVGKVVGMYLFPQLCNSTDSLALADQMVEQGRLGVKSGRGLKDYSQRSREEIQAERNLKILKMVRCMRKLAQES